MSKIDGWEKIDAYTWRKSAPTFRAEIAKVTGNASWPYMWDVYPLPRADHISERGRYMALAKGSETKLAEAKAKADAAIAEHTN